MDGCGDGAMIDRTTGIVTDVPFSRAELSGLMWDSKRGSNLLLTHWIDRNWDDPNNQTNTHCVFQASVLKDGKFESLLGYPKKVPGTCPES